MFRTFMCVVLGVMGMAASAQNAEFRMTLDGTWLFHVDSLKPGVSDRWYSDSLDRSSWQTVETPKYWEEYPGLAGYDGWGWFFRTFSLSKSGEPLTLYFAGVDDDAVVWVNNVEVGRIQRSVCPGCERVGEAGTEHHRSSREGLCRGRGNVQADHAGLDPRAR